MTVIVVVFVTPNQRAVIVAVVGALTAVVVTANAPLDAPPLTTVSAGTWTAGLLLESWTTAPSVARVKRTVPVAPPPPTTVVGVTDTADSCAPAGVAALTERFAVRGTLPTAAMICTIVSGAAALVEIVKSTEIAPAGTVAVAGTLATLGYC